jgi:hypothetical protein
MRISNLVSRCTYAEIAAGRARALIPPTARAVSLLLGALALAGCTSGSIGTTIISSFAVGFADQAAGTRQDYPGKQPLSAVDGKTDASSKQPKYNEVSGNVHVVPAAVGVKDIDEAEARSSNNVQTNFNVTKADSFTFSIDLDIENPAITGKGALDIRVSAYVLDSKGQMINDTNGNPAKIFDGTFQPTLDPQGKMVVGDPSGGSDPLDANKAYKRTLKGPNGGIPLAAGDYQVKLELWIDGRAPPGQGTAGVDQATATISLL